MATAVAVRSKPMPRKIIKAKDSLILGRCPKCGLPGQTRERRINGNDKCVSGHTYPSKDARYDK